MTPVTIAVPGVDLTQFHVEVALDQGFFRQHGLDVTLTEIPTTPALAALQSGSIQFATQTGSATRVAIQGLPVRVVTFTQITALSLVSAPTNGSVAELAGKRVGFGTVGGDNDTYLRAALATAHLNASDVQNLSMGSATDIYQGLVAGEIDAGIVAAPYTQQLQEQGFNALTGPDILALPSGGLAASVQELQQQPEIVDQALQAITDGIAWAKSHPDEASQYFAEKYGLSPNVAQLAYQQSMAALRFSYSEDELDGIIERASTGTQASGNQVSPADVFNLPTFARFGTLAQGDGLLAASP